MSDRIKFTVQICTPTASTSQYDDEINDFLKTIFHEDTHISFNISVAQTSKKVEKVRLKKLGFNSVADNFNVKWEKGSAEIILVISFVI